MYLSLILSMYAGVHSSVKPQHSHIANWISIFGADAPAAAVVDEESWVDTIIGSLITVADICSLWLLTME